MRVKLAVAVLTAFFMFVGSAQAWYMGWGQARDATKRYSKQSCAEDPECIAWGVGPCLRASAGRFNCIQALFYEGLEYGQEIECNTVLHIGVSYTGFVQVKSRSRPNCFYL